MTRNQLRSLILERMDELDGYYECDYTDPEEQISRECSVLYEVADQMARAGFPRLHTIGLTMRVDESLHAVKNYLARCLRALQPTEPHRSKPAKTKAGMLTPPQVAERYGVSPDTVRAWIISGELRAVNVGKGKRPRHRVPVEALKELDAKHLVQVVPVVATKRRRRKKTTDLLVTRFSSGH